ELDGKHVPVWIEQEPGASGVALIDHYRRRVLEGWEVRGYRSTGSKEVRANPVSAWAEAGNVKLVRGPWIGEFLDEIEVFPHGAHDERVDVVSGAFDVLTSREPRVRTGARTT